MNTKYVITLNNKRIGTTLLEKADAPMGVIIGLVEVDDITSPYQFILKYCTQHKVELNENDPTHEAIWTQSIDDLRVFDETAAEIKGEGVALSGCKNDGYYIEIFGIPYPLYEEEFLHHRKAYERLFN